MAKKPKQPVTRTWQPATKRKERRLCAGRSEAAGGAHNRTARDAGEGSRRSIASKRKGERCKGAMTSGMHTS